MHQENSDLYDWLDSVIGSQLLFNRHDRNWQNMNIGIADNSIPLSHFNRNGLIETITY
jgi:hypothetical protein